MARWAFMPILVSSLPSPIANRKKRLMQIGRIWYFCKDFNVCLLARHLRKICVCSIWNCLDGIIMNMQILLTGWHILTVFWRVCGKMFFSAKLIRKKGNVSENMLISTYFVCLYTPVSESHARQNLNLINIDRLFLIPKTSEATAINYRPLDKLLN